MHHRFQKNEVLFLFIIYKSKSFKINNKIYLLIN